MSVRGLTTKAVFLVLALVVYSANILPQQRYVEASKSLTSLRFGQSVALSDFDADGFIDEARIAGSSPRKSIEVLLSRTGKLVVLHFDTDVVATGSLLAEDVDNDGATDLIWTDLLHAEDVVVWLGDGSGQFQQVPASEYSSRFTLGVTNFAVPDGSTHETAIGCGGPRPLVQAFVQKYAARLAVELPDQRPDRIVRSSPALGQPTDRGPPLLLS